MKDKYEEIGAIYKLKDGTFEAGPWVSADPICKFDNPHDAEKYLRNCCGIHDVVKTECFPLMQLSNGEPYPFGAVVVRVRVHN